jgi:very-short-patch-repair endonuclease
MRIKDRDYSREELQNIADGCFDRTAFVMALGWTYYNGKLSKTVDEIVKTTGISIEHFDAVKKNKARRKYPIIKKNCPVCGKEFETQQGHPKETETCSYICSNVYFTPLRHTEEANKKTSGSMIKLAEESGKSEFGIERVHIKGSTYKVWDKICLKCNQPFKGVKGRKYCSQICSAWIACHNKVPSFAEQITIEILNELGFQLEQERQEGKWFIDFSDPIRKIALEIDGKYHDAPERKAKDFIKDNYLISQGWQVHRIKWKKLTKEFRQEVKDRIEKILNQSGV